MAYADYHLCDQCGAKTFYDADVEGFYDHDSDEWLYGCEGVRGYRAYALCKECEVTHEIVIVPRDSDTRRMAETGTGSGRSPGSAVPNGQSPNPQPVSEADLDALVKRLPHTEKWLRRHGWDDDANNVNQAATAITSLRNQLTASEARERTLREALAKVLPVGNKTSPGDRVVAFYLRMDELRALHQLTENHHDR